MSPISEEVKLIVSQCKEKGIFIEESDHHKTIKSLDSYRHAVVDNIQSRFSDRFASLATFQNCLKVYNRMYWYSL